MKTFLSAGLKTGQKIGLALGLTLTSLTAFAGPEERQEAQICYDLVGGVV